MSDQTSPEGDGTPSLLGRARGWWGAAREVVRRPDAPLTGVRRADDPVLDDDEPLPGKSSEYRIPVGLVRATEWTWRLLILTAGFVVLMWLIIRLRQIVIPVAIALLLTALLYPLHRRFAKILPPLGAAGATVVTLILAVSGTLYLVGAQFASQFDEISAEIADGVGDLRTWIVSTFALDDTQIDTFLQQVQDAFMSLDLTALATSAGITIGQILVGVVLALFILFFFLGRGEMFYAWFIRMLPRHARVKGLVAGNLAWGQLASYTRATVVVAAVDGIGIGLGALALGVPFPLGIAVLTFLGAFIPIVGAFLAGAIAVLLAFVSNGVVNALLMLAIVLLVQQIEGNVLQPVLMGRAVRVHPLGIVLAVAAGIQLAGIIGAVIAVPIAAMLNAIAIYLLQPDPAHFRSPADLVTPEQAEEVRRETRRARRVAEIPPPRGSAATILVEGTAETEADRRLAEGGGDREHAEEGQGRDDVPGAQHNPWEHGGPEVEAEGSAGPDEDVATDPPRERSGD
ncbi:MAG: AI-2E family transporter [Actinomycetia bacterium]|nr:AI-2E family transporter [Actinomycetes bacterium]